MEQFIFAVTLELKMALKGQYFVSYLELMILACQIENQSWHKVKKERERRKIEQLQLELKKLWLHKEIMKQEIGPQRPNIKCSYCGRGKCAK